MKDIELRDISLTDIHEKYVSLKQALAPLSELSLSTAQLAELYFERQHSGIRTIVAALEDEIIGTGSIMIERKLIHNGGNVGHIEDVSVSEDYQSMGVGSMVIKHLLDIAKDAQCYKVVLTCASKNVAFYEKFGFCKHEISMRSNLEKVP